jgi:hypothetical protein
LFEYSVIYHFFAVSLGVNGFLERVNCSALISIIFMFGKYHSSVAERDL